MKKQTKYIFTLFISIVLSLSILSFVSYKIGLSKANTIVNPVKDSLNLSISKPAYSILPNQTQKKLFWFFNYSTKDSCGFLEIYISPTGTLIGTNPPDAIEQIEKLNKKSNVIEDDFYGDPFNIETPDTNLPDSLGGINVGLFVVLTMTIDSSAQLLDHSISMFLLKDSQNDSELVRFSSSGDNKEYPAEVNRYNAWINEIVFNTNISTNPKFDKKMEETYDILVPIKRGSK